MPQFPALMISDSIGLLCSIVSISMILLGMKRLGGKISNALFFFLMGISVQTVIFLYSVVVIRLQALGPSHPNIYVLSSLSAVFFVIGAFKFLELSK